MTKLLLRLFVRDYENTGDCTVRKSYGTLAGVVGIICNLLLFMGKLVGGWITGSVSIAADALNNLSDAASSIVTLIGFRMAGQKADARHPFGHGRIEYLSGLLVSLLILLMGVELIRTSVGCIIDPEPVAFSVPALIILGASVALKAWMSVFQRALGKRIGSASLKATSMDSLSDMFATGAVLAGTLIAHFTNWYLDGWIGLLVALLILRAGWNAAKDTISPLLGNPPDSALVKAIEDTVLSHPEILGIHDLIVHDYGPGNIMLSLHAEVPASADLFAMHDRIDHIERELKAAFGAEAVIHMDPIVNDDETVNELRLHVSQLVCAIDPAMSIHDFRMTAGPLHTNLIFDVVVPHRFRLSDDEVCIRIEQSVKALNSNFNVVIEIDRLYIESL